MASRIHKRKNGNGLLVIFYNPIDRSSSEVFFTTNEKEAIKKCRELDCEFYTIHPYLIPSGISLDKAAKRFRVYTRYGFMKSHKTLMQAVEQKHHVINDLTEMKYFKTSTNGLFSND